MDNVLITGGSGFIGHWLQERPFGMCVSLTHYLYDHSEWMDAKWRYIIHLAPVPVDDVITCARRSNAHILYASSGGVYDREPDEYFRMKLEDEKKLLASGLNVKIARIFTTCGARMKWERYAIGNFIKQAERGGPINVQSYGLVVRSYMYGSDLAEWLWCILLDGKPGSVYNVGSDVPHSTQELAWEIAGHYEPKPQINIIRKMENEARPFYVPDTRRAEDELGLSIKVPFEDAIKRTVEDYRNER
jgi:nucleoside-diphosphate-sugar epimerase